MLSRWSKLLLPFHPFWVNDGLKAAKDGDDFIPIGVQTGQRLDALLKPEQGAAFVSKLQSYIDKARKKGNTDSGARFLLFMIFRANIGAFFQLLFATVLFVIIRTLNNFFYIQLMAVLAADPSQLVVPREPMPSVAESVTSYCASSVLCAWISYYMDSRGRFFAQSLRLQLIWALHCFTLKTNEAHFASTSLGNAISLTTVDAVNMQYGLGSISSLLAYPIDLAVLFYLCTTQIGLYSVLAAFGFLLIILLLKTVLMRVAARKQTKARETSVRKIGVFGDALLANWVVKLLCAEDQLLGQAKKLRLEEEGLLGWVCASNATTIWFQISMAPMMTLVSILVEDSLSSTALSSSTLLTVLGFYRTASSTDVFKILSALQSIAYARVSASSYCKFFCNAAAAEERMSSARTQGAAAASKGREKNGEEEEEEEEEGSHAGEDDSEVVDEQTPLLVDFSQATFSWNTSSSEGEDSNDAHVLENLTAKLPMGVLIGIAGGVGSGKSSFLLSILSELYLKGGAVTRHPAWLAQVGFSSQRAWIPGGPLVDLITFGKEKHNETSSKGGDCDAGSSIDNDDDASDKDGVGEDDNYWLQQVIYDCGLADDIKGFDDGIQHHVGEDGAGLSGGQKARVCLARAVYPRCEITILDDPLCALDPQLAQQVFHRLLAKEGGIVRGPGRSVILVTQNDQFLSLCDVVVVIKDQTVAAHGAYDDLVAAGHLMPEKHAPPPPAAAAAAAAVERDSYGSSGKGVHLVSRKEGTNTTTIAGTATDFNDDDDNDDDDDGGQVMEEIHLKRMMAMPRAGLAYKPSFQITGADTLVQEGDSGYEGEVLYNRTRNKRISSVVYSKLAALKGTTKAMKESKDQSCNPSEGEEEDKKAKKPPSNLRTMFRAVGWVGCTVALLCIVLAQGTVYIWQFALKDWLDDSDESFEYYLNARVLIVAISVLSFVGAGLHFWLFLKATTSLQLGALESLMRSPLSFFSDNEVGGMVNILVDTSQDVQFILSMSICAVYMLGAQIIGTLVVTIISLPYIIALLVPLGAVYYYVQRRYAKASVPFRLQEILSRGGLVSCISNDIKGLALIHAFHQEHLMGDQFMSALEVTGGLGTLVIGAFGWLSFISNVIIFGIIVVSTSVLISLLFDPGPDSDGPLVLSNIFQLSSIVGATAILISTVETTLTSIQQLTEYVNLPNEIDVVRKNNDGNITTTGEHSTEIIIHDSEKLEGWPHHGNIKFSHVIASYKWNLPPALKDITFTIPAGSSCSMVGRSGSGKSTILLALTGMIPILSGKILVDEVDVLPLPLGQLRRGVAVVPQDPVIFVGSIRQNLDMGGEREDKELEEMLEIVGLSDACPDLNVSAEGCGLSQGQKQLLCMTRALLRDKTILWLDEANASVDGVTERKMKQIVDSFAAGEIGVSRRKRTVVEIAHRLSSVIEMDQVVVLNKGQVVEIGCPKDLAKDTSTKFYEMLQHQHSAGG